MRLHDRRDANQRRHEPSCTSLAIVLCILTPRDTNDSNDARIGPAMTQRSPMLGAALLLAPTMCVVALRYGSDALEEVISQDDYLRYSIHAAAILVGVVMFMRYRKVQDHEFHRSRAIRKLSKTYSREDRGLWDKGEAAIERMEAKASAPSTGRKALKAQALRSGTVGSLNTERSEEDIGEDIESPQPATTGISTMVDEEAIVESKDSGVFSRISGVINRRLDASAERRIARSASKASKRPPSSTSSDDQWSTSAASSLTRSVISCTACGALNNSGTPYCTSCGEFLT